MSLSSLRSLQGIAWITAGAMGLALVAVFTVVLTLRAPAWWLHPFGPLLKNLPVLALVLVVMAREGR